jgi:hypothetical protein
MRSRAAKRAPAGKVPYPSLSQQDHPYKDYEAKGRDFYAKLKQSKNGKSNKLTDYQKYLLTKHFPAHEKKYLAEQKSAGASKRKEARRAANMRAGLKVADEVEDENKDSDANDGNGSANVFKRKAPSKVLLT